jgi:uncharacterized phiE125 gp8 family phage protein
MILLGNYTVLTRTTATPVVSTADLKLHLKISNSAEDALIAAYEMAAVRMVENFIQASVQPITAEAYFQSLPWDNLIRVANWSITSITAITYKDAAGDDQALTADTDYEVSLHEYWPTIRFLKIPTTNNGLKAFKVSFAASMASPNELIIQAIKLLVGQMYKYREDYNNGAATLPMNMQNLLLPLRKWSF